MGDGGPASLSLRAVAADIGVSHTAPRYHFGSNTGLLTAMAAEGFGILRDRLAELRTGGAPFIELGVAYVEFAASHPAHFAVMFQPMLLDPDDPAYAEASAGAFGELRAGLDALSEHAPRGMPRQRSLRHGRSCTGWPI